MTTYLDQLNTQLAALNTAKTAAFNKRRDKINAEIELTRQLTEKRAENDTTNANYIEGYLLPAAAIERQNAIAEYEDAAKLVEDKAAEIVEYQASPQYQKEFDANNEQAQGQIDKAIIEAKAKLSSVMQGTTKYLIYGTIALVIVIGVIIIVRKKLKP